MSKCIDLNTAISSVLQLINDTLFKSQVSEDEKICVLDLIKSIEDFTPKSIINEIYDLVSKINKLKNKCDLLKLR